MAVATACTVGVETLPARQPLKLRGRKVATDELRKRCLARVREDRARLISRLRSQGGEEGDDKDMGLRAFARELIQEEAQADAFAAAPPRSCSTTCAPDEALELLVEPFDEEDMLALEEEMLRILQREAVNRAVEEAEWLEQLQNEEDCALYEQHLLGGVPCPLCGTGRLEQREGELCCSSCMEMRTPLFDASLSLDDISDMLGLAEDRHRQSGCSLHANFGMSDKFGTSVLCQQCGHCGWSEIVL